MRSEQSLGRGVRGRPASGALALVVSMMGCGGAASVSRDSEAAETKRLLAELKFQRTTLTPKELGETYPEDVWKTSRRGFAPVYGQITEADAFQWEYLGEVREKRRDFLAMQEKIRAEERIRAEKAAEKERQRKAKVDARAAARAERARVVEKTERASAPAAPGAASTPTQ